MSVNAVAKAAIVDRHIDNGKLQQLYTFLRQYRRAEDTEIRAAIWRAIRHFSAGCVCVCVRCPVRVCFGSTSLLHPLFCLPPARQMRAPSAMLCCATPARSWSPPCSRAWHQRPKKMRWRTAWPRWPTSAWTQTTPRWTIRRWFLQTRSRWGRLMSLLSPSCTLRWWMRWTGCRRQSQYSATAWRCFGSGRRHSATRKYGPS